MTAEHSNPGTFFAVGLFRQVARNGFETSPLNSVISLSLSGDSAAEVGEVEPKSVYAAI